jgi:hypothetical protein
MNNTVSQSNVSLATVKSKLSCSHYVLGLIQADLRRNGGGGVVDSEEKGQQNEKEWSKVNMLKSNSPNLPSRDLSSDQEISKIMQQASTIKETTSQIGQENLGPTKYSAFDLSIISSMTESSLNPNNSYTINVLHIENTTEFYAQTSEHLPKSLDHSQTIQKLLKKYEQTRQAAKCPEKSSKPSFNRGDLLFSKYEEDNEWYRCLVTDISKSNDSSITDDGFEYQIYFVDFGNKQSGVKSNTLLKFESLKAQLVDCDRELNDIFTLPFQAVCCEIKDAKNSSRNTEILQKLIANDDCPDLKIKILASKKQLILVGDGDKQKSIEIKKYVVNLFSNKSLLNKEFESPLVESSEHSLSRKVGLSSMIDRNYQNEQTIVNEEQQQASNGITLPLPNLKLLKIGSEYEGKICELDFEDGSFYLNMSDEAGKLSELEKELTSYANKVNISRKANLNDLVLIHVESENFWHRALVTKVEANSISSSSSRTSRKFHVLCIDYGLTEKVQELFQLPAQFSIDKYPAFTYKINLDQANLELEEHSNILEPFINKNCLIKVISARVKSLNLREYNVELWNFAQSCLNSCVNKTYVPLKTIESSEKFIKMGTSKIHSDCQKPLNNNQFYECRISELGNDADFFFYLTDDLDKLEDLEKGLSAAACGKSKEMASAWQPKVGDFVMAKFFLDEHQNFSWYRACVTNESYGVFYLDYGNACENLSRQDIMPLPSQYSLEIFPMLVYSVKLFQVKFSLEAHVEILTANYIDKIVKIKVVQSERVDLNQMKVNQYTVELWSGPDVHVATCFNTLIDKNYVPQSQVEASKSTRSTTSSLKEKPSTKVSVDDEAAAEAKSNSFQNYVNTEAQLKQGVIYECKIAQIDLNGELYVNLIEEANQMANLSLRLNLFSSSLVKKGLITKFRPSVGDLVVAKFFSDETHFDWCRAVVTKADKNFDVFYFDYGNSQHDVDLMDLLMLPDEEFGLRKYRVYAHGVTLNGAKIDMNDDEQINVLRELSADDKQLAVKIVDMSLVKFNHMNLMQYNVELWDSKLMKSCINRLINKRYEPLLTKREETVKTVDAKSQKQEKRILKEGSVYGVKFSEIEKDGTKIYVNLIDEFDALTKMESELRISCTKGETDNTKKNPNLGDLVAVKRESNWHRALITKLDSSSLLSVFYIDSGYSETEINLERIKRPSSKFSLENVPSFVYLTKLHQIKLNMEKHADPMRNFFDEGEFNLKVVSDGVKSNTSMGDSMIYEVEMSNAHKCLNSLVKEKSSEIHQTNLKAANTYDCQIIELNENNELFIHLTSELELVKMLENELSLYGSKTSAKISQMTEQPFKRGDLVIAKYVVEETCTWSRAMVSNVAAKDSGEYEVFFIDYGNTSTGLKLQDLLPLPAQFDTSNYQCFAHLIKLGNTQIDADKFSEFIDDFCERPCKVKVLRCSKSEKFFKYETELWTVEMSRCLNKLIDGKYEISVEKGDETELSNCMTLPVPNLKLPKIGSSCLKYEALTIRPKNFKDDFSADPTLQIIDSSQLYFEDFEKPFYLTTQTDSNSRKQLLTEMNHFYSSPNETGTTTTPHYKKNDFLAHLSEGNWYRTKVKQLDSTGFQLTLFFVDYGFEDTCDTSQADSRLRIQPLAAQFFKHSQLSFASRLIQPDQSKVIDMNASSENTVLKSFFANFLDSDLGGESLTIKVKCPLDDDDQLLGIEMLNASGKSLNRMLTATPPPPSVEPKVVRPVVVMLKVNKRDLPKQTDLSSFGDDDHFVSFVQRIDSFYVFNLGRVDSMQTRVQETCGKMLADQKLVDFAPPPKSLCDIDDCVFGKYYEDQQWYRCVVTNCDHQKNKYELFFIDFGNTEIVTREDMLVAWTTEQVSELKRGAPQAYKCKLYALKATEEAVSKELDLTFKQLVTDKAVIPKLVKIDDQMIHHVTLKIVNEREDFFETSVHYQLLANNLAQFPKFNEILLNKRNRTISKGEIEFFTEMLTV